MKEQQARTLVETYFERAVDAQHRTVVPQQVRSDDAGAACDVQDRAPAGWQQHFDRLRRCLRSRLTAPRGIVVEGLVVVVEHRSRPMCSGGMRQRVIRSANRLSS